MNKMEMSNTYSAVKKEGENSMEVAHENFKKWNDALQSKDARKVAELYSADTSFLPTVSSEFKKGTDGAEDYFENHFLPKDPSGEIVEEVVQPTGPDSYVHSGMYNFNVGPDEDRKVVEARFTFVWKKDENDQWKIIHHHSSVKPSSH